MEIKTQCPHCHGRYLVEEEVIGESITCVRCNREFVVIAMIPAITQAPEPQKDKIRLKGGPDALAKSAVAVEEIMKVVCVDMELVGIKPGLFLQGSENGYANEKPTRSVNLSHPFFMARHPVTQHQFWTIMHRNPSYFEGDDLPVETTSWNEAVEFCRRLTEIERVARRIPSSLHFRLPTEAEWEYCCRAEPADGSGVGRDYTWSDVGAELLTEYAWVDGNSEETTHPVGGRKPNRWGLHDLHGNVAEWCQDWYGPYTADEATDPKGPETGRRKVRRGGGWSSIARRCRCADRAGVAPDCTSALIGFRVVAVRNGEPPYPLNYHVW